jgi:hypothetical protein
MLGRAVTRGAKQTGSLLGDVLPAMAARAVGADKYAARQMAEAEETQKEIAQKYGARYGELADVKGIGDILPFASEVIAEQIPNIATALIPGVGGAALGGRMAAQEAAKRLAARGATQAGARYTAMKTAQGQVVGGGVGSFLGSYALNAPEVFQNIFEETGQMEPGAAALAGSVSAALDAILPAYLVRQFTPGMKAGVVEKILERSGMPPGIARQATAGVVTGAVTEGPTEAAQEAISIAAEKFVDQNAEAWGSKEFNRLVESGVRGAVGGGGISGIAGAGKGYLEKRAVTRAQRDLEEATKSKEKTAFDEIDEEGEVITPPPLIDKDKDIPLDLTPPAEVTLDEAEMQQLQATVIDTQNRLGRKLSVDELESLYNGFVREKIKRQTPEDLFDEAGLGTKVDTGAVKRGVSMPSGAGAVLGAGTGVEGAGQPVVGGAGGVPSGTREGEGRVGAPLGGQILPTGVSDEDRRAFLEEFGVRDYTQPRFTSLTPKEQEVTQQDLIDAGIDAGKANYFIRQKINSDGKKVNAEAKEAFALAAARKEGGQELLFSRMSQKKRAPVSDMVAGFYESLKPVSQYSEPETSGKPELKFNEQTGNYELYVDNKLSKTYSVVAPKLLAAFKGDARDRVISDEITKFNASEKSVETRRDLDKATAAWQESQPLNQQEQAFDERQKEAGRIINSIRQDNSLSETEKTEKIEEFIREIKPFVEPTSNIRGSLASKNYYSAARPIQETLFAGTSIENRLAQLEADMLNIEKFKRIYRDERSEEEIKKTLFGDSTEYDFPVTREERQIKSYDLRDIGFTQKETQVILDEIEDGVVNKQTKDLLSKILKAKKRFVPGQETLFAAPRGEQLGFNLAPPEEGAAYTPVESAVPFPKERPQAELELTPLEEGAERGAPPPVEQEFELARTEGKVEKVSPEMERLIDIDNFLDEVQEFFGPAVATPAQRQQNASLLREFFERVESVANPEAVAQALSYPNSRGARQRIEALAETEDLKALRNALKEFYNKKATQGLGYGPERSAFSRIDAGFGAPEGRIVTVLRLLRSLKASERDPSEKAAANYFSTFNYNIAMKSAAFDLANNIPEGDIVKGQGGKTADLFRQYIEENFPAEEYAKFESLVDAYRTNLRKAATALERYSKKQNKVAAVAKVGGMSTEEVERHISRMPLRSGKQAEFKPLHPYIEERIKANDLNGALAFMARLGKNTFNGSIASRLLDLNLSTTIAFDRQQEFFNIMINAVRPELQMFGKYLQDTYPDLYAKYLEGATDFEIAIGLEKIKKEKLLPDYVLENTAYKRLFDTYQNGITALISDGFFSPDGNAININRMFGGGTYYTFLHEIIHAATAYQIRNRDALNPDQRKALNELEELYQLAQKEMKVDEYGLTNLDEFIAEAFTSPSFQNQLRAIKYKEKDGSLWNKFMQAVLKLLGGARDNALFSTLYNADILMSAGRVTPKQGQFAGTLLNAKAPKVAKSTTAGTFKTAPDAPDQKRNKAWLESIMKRANWSAVKENMPQWLENLDDTARKYYLGAFTLRQLKDLAGEKIPQLGRFIDSVEAMLDERNTILQTVSDITKKWETYQSKNPEQTKKMNLVMVDATLAGVDPDTQPGVDADLDQRWSELDDDAKAIYREVRDFYEARLKAYRGTILKNVELAMIADNKTPEEITATLTELQTRFDANTKRPYFPLKRFGRYWVAVKENKKVTGFYMFESAGARNTFARDLKTSAKPSEAISTGNDISNLVTENIQDLQALKGIKEIVDKATESDNTDLKTAIKESLDQMYLLTLPDKSARKMFINRKEISGASADMLRAFTTSSFHMAYQHSRFKHARAMYQQIAAARAMLTPDMPDVDARVARDYIMELEQRLQYVMNPTDTGLIPSTLSNISFVWYLTAPASALINMMGVPAIGLPVVAARYGWGNTTAAMTAYAKRFLKTGFKRTELGLEAPTLERGDLDDLERRAYDRFVKDGLIDVTLSHDLAGMAEAPTNLYTGRTHKAMRILSYMFHNAEKFNREVVAMATFRMAYDKAKKDGFTDEAAFNKAVNDSKDLTYRSMFDYSTLNKPRYFQNSYTKVILQFKQFSQQMTYLLARSVYEMTANEDPAVRKEARDRLLGTLGMTFLFAGATGMPLFSIGAATIEAVHAAFSDDDEPPLDFENWFKNWMAENFGSFMGDSISRGVVTQASGLNFADRMSLNDLWFRDVRKSQDEVTALQNMFINLLGPTAGLAISGAEAVKLYNDGLYYRAAEKALPAFLKQPLVGARYMTEGALTTKGDTLVEDISGKDALGQMLGFAPEKVAQKQKANIEMKTEEQRILNERQDLLNAFFMSIDTSDDKLYDRVLDKIANFNNKYPEVAIMGSTLSRSVKERYRRRALGEVTGGISIDKRLIGSLGDMGAYGEPD